jgi:hypothetical protein
MRLFMARVSICTALSTQTYAPSASFVPRALHDYLSDMSAEACGEEAPFGTAQLGAVLFADASGFTALTERLAQSV